MRSGQRRRQRGHSHECHCGQVGGVEVILDNCTSPAQIADQFTTMARDTAADFGHLDAAQLNWQPDAGSRSVAQCFDHLLKANGEMMQAINHLVGRRASRTIGQRLPLWPRLFGWLPVGSHQAASRSTKRRRPRSPRPAAWRQMRSTASSRGGIPASRPCAAQRVRRPADHRVAIRRADHGQRAERVSADCRASAPAFRRGHARHGASAVSKKKRHLRFEARCRRRCRG